MGVLAEMLASKASECVMSDQPVPPAVLRFQPQFTAHADKVENAIKEMNGEFWEWTYAQMRELDFSFAELLFFYVEYGKDIPANERKAILPFFGKMLNPARKVKQQLPRPTAPLRSVFDSLFNINIVS